MSNEYKAISLLLRNLNHKELDKLKRELDLLMKVKLDMSLDELIGDDTVSDDEFYGDSIHDPTLTKEQLDRELDEITLR